MKVYDHHYMVDIETWDTEPTAVVRAIAVVKFSTGGSILHQTLIDCRQTVDQQVQGRRTMGGATIRWWQSQEPLDQLLKPHRGHLYFHCPEGMESIAKILETALGGHECSAPVWSRGRFDLDILKHLMESVDYQLPVNWRDTRDVRSLDELVGKVESQLPHDPLEDCLAQVQQVVQAFRQKQLAAASLSPHQLRSLCNLVMCADPTPLAAEDDSAAKSGLDILAKQLGWTGWLDAFHNPEPTGAAG